MTRKRDDTPIRFGRIDRRQTTGAMVAVSQPEPTGATTAAGPPGVADWQRGGDRP